MDNQSPQFPAPRPAAPPGFPAPGATRPNFPAPPKFAAPPGASGGPAIPTGGPKPLVLPRRLSPLQRAKEATQAATEARRSIDAIISQSRAPWGGEAKLSGSQFEELQKTIAKLEAKLAERELSLATAEGKLAERERELAEAETLLAARTQVVEAAQKQTAGGAGPAVSAEQEAALLKLKEELDRQEQSIKEQRQALKEREEFLDQSETALFEKMQAQQEKETELEQKEEDIKRLARQAGLLKNEPQEPMEKA